jgi:hypothetical protein
MTRLAAGVFAALCCALVPGIPSTLSLQDAPPAAARFVNARLETRGAESALGRQLAAIASSRQEPGWIGYAVPAVPGESNCEADRPARVYLEGRPKKPEVRLEPTEGTRVMTVLLRAEAGRIQRIRQFSADCELDAGGLPVSWLTGVTAAQSVAALENLVEDGAESPERLSQSALTAIALHRDPAAQVAVENLASARYPIAVRKRAAFWLAVSRGTPGFEALRRMVAAEADSRFRRELVFPLSLVHRPEAVGLLVRAAREDASLDVRKQAMFWLSRSDEPAAVKFTEEILKK